MFKWGQMSGVGRGEGCRGGCRGVIRIGYSWLMLFRHGERGGPTTLKIDRVTWAFLKINTTEHTGLSDNDIGLKTIDIGHTPFYLGASLVGLQVKWGFSRKGPK